MARRLLKLTVILLIVAALIAACIPLVRWGYDKYLRAAYPIRYEQYVTTYAAEQGLPPSLVYAVIRTESGFEADAQSAAGAKGLMQLMDATFETAQRNLPGEALPIERVFDPDVNIRSGCWMLGYCFSKFEDPTTALAAYNAGHNRVRSWLKDSRYSEDGVTLKEIPLEETKNYVERVLDAQQKYIELYKPDKEEY